MKKSPDWTWARFDGGRFGSGLVLCHGDAICRVWLPGSAPRRGDGREGGAAGQAAKRLEAAFLRGEELDDLEVLIPDDCPAFLRRVYEACRAIPRGEVLSYRALAEAAGNPAAARAAGNAMKRNPLPLAVPCHRVVRSDGSLGHYGGGAEMKRWLLEREGALPTNKA